MKRTVLLFCALTIAVLLYPQEPTGKSVQQILMSKTWHMGEDLKKGCRFVFTRDSVEFYFVGAYGYDNFNGKLPYYLSDIEDESFDNSKVGKSENGVYLIMKSPGATPNLSYKRILEINDSQIRFENSKKRILIYTAVE
ncbi:hypothetical protein [uncultured Bacteroides sp.]|uniref:hypothetical protein n=2 Tax=uncultured Bacteroides sp. TaxID=162156 RepID=UPI00261F1599|nr:hypothetical protein [uncultured Bacteroides sp.]